MKEIDPFTFYGTFNRGIREDQRLGILAALKKHFSLQSKLPEDFDGIPILNNMRSWFIGYQSNRKIDDVARLWRVFRLALGEGEKVTSTKFGQDISNRVKIGLDRKTWCW